MLANFFNVHHIEQNCICFKIIYLQWPYECKDFCSPPQTKLNLMNKQNKFYSKIFGSKSISKILVFTNFTSLVLISTMIALLVILSIIELYARNNTFKELYKIKLWTLFYFHSLFYIKLFISHLFFVILPILYFRVFCK